MNPGLVVKLRPSGPWRIGPDSGARNQVDAIYHSDSLYAAVTSAMMRLGELEAWLAATARNDAPAVRFSSCFPFLDEIGFVTPPRNLWPPAAPALLAARVRWKSARFVPLGIVQALLSGQTLDETQWIIDGPSNCLLPAGRPGPFRTGIRWNAAVDRLAGSTERHSTACLEFRSGAGFWTIVSFSDESARDRWGDLVKAAFRWLADSGFGGERSRGWGRSESPEFTEGTLPDMILGAGRPEPGPGSGGQLPASSEQLAESEGVSSSDLPASEPRPPAPAVPPPGNAQWLLSLFTPAAADSVDWTRGSYTVLTRAGRVDSPAGSGELKKNVQMIAEGSVLYAGAPLRGSAPDVAPDGFAHPVFRAGFALSIPLPEAS
jgi:CRISPR type III-A-associated RAMP protein Csm4